MSSIKLINKQWLSIKNKSCSVKPTRDKEKKDAETDIF